MFQNTNATFFFGEMFNFIYLYIYICRVTDCSPHLDGNREWAQRAQYNKFVREWVEELGQQIFATVIGGRVLGRGG